MVPSLAKISCCNVYKNHHKNHVCSTPKVKCSCSLQQFSLKFIFDVEIKKTEVPLSVHDEQCQVDGLSILFLDI